MYNLKKEESKEHKTEKTASGQKKAESKQVTEVHSACRRVLGTAAWGQSRVNQKVVREGQE